MKSFKILSLVLLVPLAAACIVPTGIDVTGGAGGATSGTTAASTTSSSGGSLTCADVDEGVGCCDATGALRYCTSAGTVGDQTCAAGTVCGWNGSKLYYDCISGAGGVDPSGKHPIACGASSSSTSSSSSSTASSSSSTSSSSSSTASSSSSSSGGGTTWTELYNTVFGPSGSSSCVKGGGCHTGSQSGFKCGTSATACYNGLVSAGWVNPGSSASASPFGDPTQSPLCGSGFSGNMPKGGGCPSASALTKLQSWLSSGAPDN